MHAPLVTVKIKNRTCTFVTNDIKHMMISRDHLHRIFLSTRRQTDWMAFVTSHTLVKSALRQAEKDNYMTETLDNKNILFLYGKLLTIVSFQRIETRLITQRIHHWWQIN